MPLISIGQFTIAVDHPCLPGHFPRRPIVPGAVLLDEALALVLARFAGATLCGLAVAKFTSATAPVQNVEVLCAPGYSDSGAHHSVDFACVIGETRVLHATALLSVRAD